ncbi:hypothetical protein B0A50_06202 [Salinomyces thailandicus]|uniref:Hsp90 chaperone protein kinase-targeting subunit n=1 Tax=Salinomyces thailandicus TaxID=706561 RepID=A0A4U0TSZ8_9PEZI|nr:hypothetical protein B0A50_06202 [Salinomyces thailandica]
MPVDYSKWDALELSDDSDIEVHPNVDKRSFIRAKQTQIHQQRVDRKHRITTLKYEKVINDGLLLRIDALLKSLEGHKKDVEGKKDGGEVDEVVFDCLLEINEDGSLGADEPPRPPEGVHTQDQQQPVYSKMMGALVDQVKSEVDKSKLDGVARYEAYLAEASGHKTKVQGLQKDLMAELNKLEREEGSKITSDNLHEGFNSSWVSQGQPAAPAAAATKTAKKGAKPELLNPGRMEPGMETPGSEADIEDGGLAPAPGEEAAEDDDMEASATAKQFGKIKFGDYQSSLQFIGKHPEILAEKETDGLLVEAFNGQTNAKSKTDEDYARQCVHQALLLQYCRQLGKDGVGLFFKRITTQGHQARKLFLDDVNSTYDRIRSRTAELNRQKDDDPEGGVEQIQLHAVDPNTTINIVTPPPMEQCNTDDARASRTIFETFPPGLKRALESGSLDRVNEVLGKMSVDEAEQIVEQLGNGGMLSLEEGVIDATTDEGKKTMKEIERTHQMPGEKEQERIVEVDDQMD